MRMTHQEFAKFASDRGIKIDNPLIDEGVASQTLTVPYPPSTNKHWQPVIIAGRATMVLSKAGRAYKQTVANIGLLAKVKPMTGHLSATIVLTAANVQSDIDNVFKGLFDSLNGVLWEDDRQVYEIHAYKRVQKPASVTITIKRVDEIGAVK